MADPNHPPTNTVFSTFGEEIIRIIAPVSTCMLIVVLLVTALSSSDSPQQTLTSIATIAYCEPASDSFWNKLKGAVFNSLAFVAVLTLLTFILLFYLRLTTFFKSYMAFSSFVVLLFLGGEVCLLLVTRFVLPLDAVASFVLLINFSVVGVMAVFLVRMPILVTQGYLVVIGVLVAYCFTMLPEWSTWALLVAMALYDLAAVLLPGGPLRLLADLAISRDEEIPALVYEARPVEPPPDSTSRRRVWRETRGFSESSSGSNSNDLIESGDVGADPVPNSDSLMGRRDIGANQSINLNGSTERRDLGTNPGSNPDDSSLGGLLRETRLVIDEDGPDQQVPLLNRRHLEWGEEEGLEGIGLGSSGAIKLGLGDFIFYSVLVGRAALYDFTTVYACYLAIISGLVLLLTPISATQSPNSQSSPSHSL